MKDGKGGLRDLHTLFWIAKYLYRVEDVSQLVGVGFLNADEFKAFEEAEEFLWLVRCHLHLLAGRAEERLTFDAQVEIARIARARYREGVADYLEVLDAERNLFSAEQQLLATRRAWLQNRSTLFVSLGGG